MKRTMLFAVAITFSLVAAARNVSLSVNNRPAAEVFRSLMAQTGKNFVYSSDILEGMRVTLDARDQPLDKVLRRMFDGTGIEYRIKGRNVVLKRTGKKTVSKSKPVKKEVSAPLPESFLKAEPVELEEVIVVSRLEAPQVESVEIGAGKFTPVDIVNTPVIFSEPDVMKTLHKEPGIVEGLEGFAGMYVHGGNGDENLCMFDNIPLYNVNHFGGLFSAFNLDAVRYIDFFKSSMPAKYDGRLSSFLDVRTRNGSSDGHHGSAKLGLTSGAFSIGGPIGKKTTYNVALRRSWYDVLTVPMFALVSSLSDETFSIRYDFMDLNAKLNHQFNSQTSGFINFYFGNDEFHGKDKYDRKEGTVSYPDDKYDLNWGNIMAQIGMVHKFNDDLTGEFTGGYVHYFSQLKAREKEIYMEEDVVTSSVESLQKTSDFIDDGILRADFTWNPADNSGVRFGGGYTLHSFQPQKTLRQYEVDDMKVINRDSVSPYIAGEFNAYIEDDWRISSRFRVNAGVHLSMFHIEGRDKFGVSPRLSMSYRPHGNWAVKGAYSRTVQYVHQLTQSNLALPTDQWIPLVGDFKPETADKISLGAYWESPGGEWSASVEGYWKWMRNIVDYRDEYYLTPPLEFWNSRLTSGKGTAKGIDFKFERRVGKITGHIAYSLAWSDRTFAEKNGGMTYPARFDNRHTINILLNWKMSSKVELNIGWTGHSGNRFTFMPQIWQAPEFSLCDTWFLENSLRVPLNNFQLPFYHRLDLGLTVRNRRGYWSFGLYNAYCNRNTIAITRGYVNERTEWNPGSWDSGWRSRPVFEKLSLLPIIPSIAYTWQF